MTTVHLHDNSIATVHSADGVTGVLCVDATDHSYFLRVYRESGDFTDYALHHSDLRVTIADTDAAFYHEGSRTWLDHRPETLGLQPADDRSSFGRT